MIQGLLRRVKTLPILDDLQGPDLEAEVESEVTLLIGGALVRSGFEITN